MLRLSVTLLVVGMTRDEKGTFTKMYGSDHEYIDVTSVLPVAKTMNKKFLQK